MLLNKFLISERLNDSAKLAWAVCYHDLPYRENINPNNILAKEISPKGISLQSSYPYLIISTLPICHFVPRLYKLVNNNFFLLSIKWLHMLYEATSPHSWLILA